MTGKMQKVLVVDDSPTIRRHLGTILRDGGFDVIEAGDGAEGTARVNEDPDIGMVILDVNMPNMNGLEMLQRIKQSDRNAGLPVVMLTTEAEVEMIEQAKRAGAAGWIVKPFKPELLLAAVRKILASRA
jgi:two-component system chemotaxis response regulator CheY